MNIPELLRGARVGAGLTQAELAERSGTSQPTVSAYEQGAKTPSADTLERLLAAAGMRLAAVPAARPVRLPPAAELESRGRVLAQVLDLAERLPARRSRTLRFPRLPSSKAA